MSVCVRESVCLCLCEGVYVEQCRSKLSQHVCETCGQTLPTAKDIPGLSTED